MAYSRPVVGQVVNNQEAMMGVPPTNVTVGEPVVVGEHQEVQHEQPVGYATPVTAVMDQSNCPAPVGLAAPIEEQHRHVVPAEEISSFAPDNPPNH